ncbi:DUF805 domain-containing protein [Pseudomonas oryzae]|uniref:Uncharacterized protein n=1 Tax=Pseudomonas oryzae TaxID=1392877 RepID=A0A1H1TRX4_9PSED|nr:hypothetical protein [Pseudomonas oryzae]SDS62980.1 hypothetical protein SAMN05216221_2245 [Pseudomonas oryzae]
MGMGMYGYGEWHGLGMLVVAIVFIVPLWKILTKAGFNGAWSLLMFIPLVNIIALWVFAFSEWPKGRRD